MSQPLKSIVNLTTQLTSRFIKQPGSVFRETLFSPKPWWVKIHTQSPAYTYYFGPFDARVEAVMAQFGYIEDLEQENAQNIRVEIGQFSPLQLTSCENLVAF